MTSEQPCPVSTHTEWDPLEEVIVGSVEDAVIAPDHCSVRAVVPDKLLARLPGEQGRPFPPALLDAARRELQAFVDLLQGAGITVRRPVTHDSAISFKTPYWSSRGFCYACPRDGFLIIGDQIIETPMAWRSRFFEGYAYKPVFQSYFDNGARWVAAPRPMLRDEVYDPAHTPSPPGMPMTYVINESEILFDAADFMRCGRDIFCQLSNVTNMAGVTWLRRHLGDGYKVHLLETVNWRKPMHIDASFIPLAPGKLLINPADFDVEGLPPLVRKWDLIIAPEPEKAPPGLFSDYNMCSDWLALNIFSLDEKRLVVEQRQTGLARLLEKHGFDVVLLPFEHYNPFGGAFHCATLDVRRRGTLESYF